MSTNVTRELLLNEYEVEMIDTNKKLTVFGYIRDIIQNIVIPKEINIIILAFYTTYSDEFDRNLFKDILKDCCELSDDNKIATQTWGPGGWRSFYGKKIISSINIGKYIWKIQNVSKTAHSECLFLGIDNGDKPNCINKSLYDNKIKASYSYYVDKERIDQWNGPTIYNWEETPKFKKDDIITITLEITKTNGILTFERDNGCKTVVNNITREKSLNYRLCVAFGDPDLSVKLVD